VASDELGRWCSKVNLSEMLNVAKRTRVQYRANACMYTDSEKSYSTRLKGDDRAENNPAACSLHIPTFWTCILSLPRREGIVQPSCRLANVASRLPHQTGFPTVSCLLSITAFGLFSLPTKLNCVTAWGVHVLVAEVITYDGELMRQGSGL